MLALAGSHSRACTTSIQANCLIILEPYTPHNLYGVWLYLRSMARKPLYACAEYLYKADVPAPHSL